MSMFPLGVTVEILLNGAWTDISQYVYQRDPIQITGGRVNWADTVQPATCTMTLNNRDGRFTSSYISGDYYPYLTRNVQIRVGVTAVSSSGNFYSGYRFWGKVPEWPPQSDISGNDVYVQITAAGPLREVSAGADQGSALERYYGTLTGSFAPIAYWPCEEDAFSSGVGSGDIGSVAGGPYMVITGSPTYKAISAFDGSAPIGILNRSIWTGVTGTFNSSGDDIYQVPGTYMWTAGTSTVNCKVWGGGGGGDNGYYANGGGGGEFAQEATLAVTPGNSYKLVVGARGQGGGQLQNPGRPSYGQPGNLSSFAGDVTTVIAHGGGGGNTSPGNGGTGSVNTVHHDGGVGGAAVTGGTHGGAGGGGSGGTASAGNAGHANSGFAGGPGGAAVAGGGAGGTGRTGPNDNQAGTFPQQPGGGGGGGAYDFAESDAHGGDNGASGKVELIYTPQSVPVWNVIRAIVLVPPHGGNNTKVLLRGVSSSTTLQTLDLVYGTGGVLALHGFNSVSALVVNSGNQAWNIDGQSIMVSIELQQSGTSVNWALRAVVPGSARLLGSATGTLASATVGNITEIIAGPNGDITKTAMGHISLQYALVPLLNVSNHLNAHIGEMGIDRFIRLANEQALDNAPQFNETNDHWSWEDNSLQGWAGVNATPTVSTVTAFPPSVPWGPIVPNATPTNPSYFQTTTALAGGISVGDQFNSILNLGQTFYVTSLGAPVSGNVQVNFQPMAKTAVLGTTDSLIQVQSAGQDPMIPAIWPTDGARSLRISSAGGAGSWSSVSPTGTSGQLVNPGDTVSVAAHVYTPAALTAVFVAINWYSGVTLLSSTTNAYGATTAGQIVHIPASGVAPATADHFSISVGDNATVGAGVLLYVDHVRVHPQMGPQTAKAYAEFLKEIHVLDQGLLKESKILHGLGYVTRIGLMARSPQVTLDYTRGTISPPLQPVFDDLLTTNVVSVKRSKGTTVTVSQQAGAMNVLEPPAGIGKKKKTQQVVANTDQQLAALAAQLLLLGTNSDERYPVVTVDLTRASIPGNALAPLMSAVAQAEPGDNIQISNLPFWYPNTTARQLIIGYAETIYSQPRDPGGGWLITWNCVPYNPYLLITSAIRRW